MTIDGTPSGAVSLRGRAWRMRPADDDRAASIGRRLGLHDAIGRLLAGRGFCADTAPAFLSPRLRDSLPDPAVLLDLERAASRLADAAEAGERVGVLGDYDVDGATSTALLVRYLRAVGVAAVFDIPDRLSEGYGPNPAALGRLAAHGCRLVVTVDAGTTAFAPLAEAAAGGLEVIVVDHHAAEAELPRALAVVNPKRRDQPEGLGHLAACGVVFLLVVALNRELRRRGLFRRRPEPELTGWLDLVALGTVCDVVELFGLNRAFVTQGLKVAARGANPGLRALAEVGRAEGPLGAYHLGFILGPRINAGGRIGTSDLGARLLTEDDPRAATALAAVLDQLNARRRAMERTVLDAATAAAERAADDPAVVVDGAGWHPGVIGIVAGRLTERLGRPVVVVGVADGVGKGSGRSVPGIDLGALVIAARREGLLTHGGGHAMAAGLTIDAARLPDFRAFLKERVAAAGPAPAPALDLDGALSLGGVTGDLAEALAVLAPFGQGNPEPRFRVDRVRTVQARAMGEDHVGCRLIDSCGGSVRGVAFRCLTTPLGRALLDGTAPLHLAGRLKAEEWRGERRIAFHIDDAMPA